MQLPKASYLKAYIDKYLSESQQTALFLQYYFCHRNRDVLQFPVYQFKVAVPFTPSLLFVYWIWFKLAVTRFNPLKCLLLVCGS